MKKVLIPALIASALLLSNCKDGDTIEDIGSYTITTKDFEKSYKANLERIARIGNAEKSTLARLMCNPDQVSENPMWRDVIQSLEPKDYYERYRNLRIVEQAAKADNFLDDPEVKAIVELTRLEAIAQLYVQKKIEERIKISQDEKQARCQELRQKYAQEFGPLSLDECLRYAEGMIKRDRTLAELHKVQEDIKEGITISKNAKFDKTEFLANQIETYKVMKKTGGCEAGATPATGDKPKPLPLPGNPGLKPPQPR